MLPLSQPFGAGRQAGKMANKLAAIVYIRLSASMMKQKCRIKKKIREMDGYLLVAQKCKAPQSGVDSSSVITTCAVGLRG